MSVANITVLIVMQNLYADGKNMENGELGLRQR